MRERGRGIFWSFFISSERKREIVYARIKFVSINSHKEVDYKIQTNRSVINLGFLICS